jgi:hypothetical protein
MRLYINVFRRICRWDIDFIENESLVTSFNGTTYTWHVVAAAATATAVVVIY